MTDIPEHIVERMREAARDSDGRAPADWQLIAAIEALGGERVAMVKQGDIAGSTVIVPSDAAYLDHHRALLIKLEGE